MEWWQEQNQERGPVEEDFVCFFRRMKRADKLNFPKDPRFQQQTVREFMDCLKKDNMDDYTYNGSLSKRPRTMAEEDGECAGTYIVRAQQHCIRLEEFTTRMDSDWDKRIRGVSNS